MVQKRLDTDSGEDDSQISIGDLVQKKEKSQQPSDSGRSGRIADNADSGLTISGVSGVQL